MSRKPILTVTINDCRVDNFTVGGNGGGGKDTSNTGVRVTHPASGAVGKATDTRSGQKNRILAFRRMAESYEFQAWAKLTTIRLTSGKSIDTLVDEAMDPKHIRVETKGEDGKWTISTTMDD